MAHFMKTLKKGMHFTGQAVQGALGAYGTYKALGAMGAELYGGIQAARGLAAGAAIAAPLLAV